MTGVHEQFYLNQGPHMGLCTPNKGQRIMQARAGGVGLQRRETTCNAHGVAARHSQSDKKPVKHPNKAFLRESSYCASFNSHELVAHPLAQHPLPETRCEQLRKRMDPRGYLLEVLGLRAPYDQDRADGDTLRREKGPKLAKTIIFEGHKEPVTRIVSPNPLRRLARIHTLVAAASAANTLQCSSTSVSRLPSSEEHPLLHPSERSQSSGDDNPRGNHDDSEHAASSSRPPSAGPPLTRRPSTEAARLPAQASMSDFKRAGTYTGRAPSPEGAGAPSAHPPTQALQRGATSVRPLLPRPAGAPSPGPPLTRWASVPARPVDSPSEDRIQIVWQPPSGASFMRDLSPKNSNALPSLVFSARTGEYWDPRSQCWRSRSLRSVD